MLAAVDLDDQPRLDAGEVGDVWTDRHLTELDPVEPPTAQFLPEFCSASVISRRKVLAKPRLAEGTAWCGMSADYANAAGQSPAGEEKIAPNDMRENNLQPFQQLAAIPHKIHRRFIPALANPRDNSAARIGGGRRWTGLRRSTRTGMR